MLDITLVITPCDHIITGRYKLHMQGCETLLEVENDSRKYWK